jgi:hypothetical protein
MLTNLAIAKEVYEYCEKARWGHLMIAIGQSIPWPVESNPPDPSPNVVELRQPLAFKVVDSLTPVYQSESGISINGRTYKRLEEHDVSRILDKGAFSVLAETTFGHNRLDFQSFREAGLLQVTQTRPGLYLWNNRIYTTQQILSYDLEVYETFPAISISTEVTETTIGIIKPFY